jgi:uncharacterized membrane protein
MDSSMCERILILVLTIILISAIAALTYQFLHASAGERTEYLRLTQ